MKFTFSLALIFIEAGLATAQVQPPAIRSTAQEVLLDVVVRDKRGHPVHDLKAGDFEVLDNGVQQKIAGFRFVSGASGGSVAPAGPGNGASPAAAPGTAGTAAAHTLDPLRQIRLVTLVFERLNQNGRTLSRQAALDLIHNESPNTYYGVFTIGQRLAVLQQYTADRDLLKKAVEQATGGTAAQFYDQSEAIAANLQTLQTSTSPVEAKTAEMTLGILSFSQQAERTQQGRSSIFSLLAVVKEQIRLPGRKTVLYFSEGLQVPSNLTEQFHSMIGVANRANVSVYAIDARGLSTDRDTAVASRMLTQAAAESQSQVSAFGKATTFEQSKSLDRAESSIRANAQNSLAELAESTGGFLVANSNDLRGPVRRISEDINSYYEISYTPQIEKYDGSFRKVAVKMDRSDLKVQTRNGYFALPYIEGQTLLPYEMPLLTALSAMPLPHDIPYRAAAMHFAHRNGQVESGIVIDVPLDQIDFVEDAVAKTHHAHIAVLAILKDAQGRVVEKFSEDVPYQLPSDKLAAAKLGHFIYTQHFNVAPGRYTLETGVLDRENQKMSARKAVYVAVPASAGIGLSSVALIRRVEAEKAQADASDPFFFEGGKITPTLIDTLSAGPGAKLSLFFIVYPQAGTTEAPQLGIEFLQDGQGVGAAKPELGKAGANGSIPYIATSPIDQLKPGQYEVRVTVRQGATAAQEHTFFTIQ